MNQDNANNGRKEQIQNLQEQARRLEAQARHLLKELRHEAKQRSKIVKQARKAGEDVAASLGSTLEASGKTAQVLVERGGKLTQGLAKRGGNFWAVLGFSVGLLAAGIATYWFLRRQVLQQQTELNQHIELPQSGSSNGGHWKRPAGEILYIEDM